METPPPLVPPPVAPPPPPPDYVDRSTWLLIFGILEIILGGLCLLMVPFMFIGQMMAAKQAGTEFSFPMAAQSALTFLILATGLIWLGIGSIKARRWARALLLCFGWMGLCIGVVSLAVVISSLGSIGDIMRQQGRTLPPGAVAVAKFFAVATVVFIYVLIPGTLVLFYRGRNVKLTCEYLDPVERWTDRCPLPVIAMCILQTYGAFAIVMTPWFGSAFPLFGYVVTGWPAKLLLFGFGAFSLFAARGFYRLQPRFWLLYTALVTAMGISTIITFLRVDVLVFYRSAGMPETQIQQIAANPVMQGHFMAWLMALSMGLYLGYLLYLRRYFSKPSALP
ncbi:MAG TPA: hypothetical protein VG734_14470 [Lacunisphaera sp.]|nr:hypothetical protein [Lacunisphaera sp.]